MAPKDPSSDSSSGEEAYDTSSGEDEETQYTTPNKPQNATRQLESESESESDSESESESEDEPERSVKLVTSEYIKEIPPNDVAAANKCTSKLDVATSKSDSDSDSDSDSESESESKSEDEPDQSVKQAVAATPEIPPKEAAAANKSSSKTATPVKSTAGAKRANEDDNKECENSKKPRFERLWTEEDEIVLLQGILDFIEVKGGFEPRKDTKAVFQSIKSDCHFSPTSSQFSNKIHSLKMKFEKKVKSGKGEGKIKEPHDQKIFELSKRIWNKGVDVGGKGPMEVDERKSKTKKVLKFDNNVSVGNMSDICGFIERKWVNFTPSETKKLEMEIAALELYLKQNELMQKKAKLVLKGLKAEED